MKNQRNNLSSNLSVFRGSVIKVRMSPNSVNKRRTLRFIRRGSLTIHLALLQDLINLVFLSCSNHKILICRSQGAKARLAQLGVRRLIKRRILRFIRRLLGGQKRRPRVHGKARIPKGRERIGTMKPCCRQ